jgi:hypothetical protein
MQTMVFGHNTNIKMGAVTFHVQTEDRGEAHALLDTTVYFHGRVLHRRTNNYYDLMPLDEDRKQALKLRLDEQHRTVLDEIRSGALQLTVPPLPEAPRAAPAPSEGLGEPKQSVAPAASEPRRLLLELLNAKTWLSGKQAKLYIVVKDESGQPAAGARVCVEIEGAADSFTYNGETGAEGQVQIVFEMPRITASEAAILVRAEDRSGRGLLRFALRAKTRVPAL